MIKHLRWYIVGLLTLATTVNYLDRQALSIAAPLLRETYGMTNTDYAMIVQAFMISYCIMHPLMGWIIDRLNTRRGFSLAVIWWSLANMLHAFAGGVGSFAVCRFLLGMGEAGNFPACIKTVAEWFPARERAMATGIFNMGAGFGAILAPPIVVWLIHAFGWQSAFIATGAAGFLWVIAWLALYHPPESHPRLDPAELAFIRAGQEKETEAPQDRRGVWRELIRRRELWGLMLARFVSDPVWWFYIFWLPDYLKNARGFSLTQIAIFAWMPFLSADFGSLAGGFLSSLLVRRGLKLLTARKTAMCICAAIMPVALLVVKTSNPYLALFYICLATFGHQAWAASLLTLPADLFPKRQVATAYGISGSASSLGGFAFAPIVGLILDHAGYGPVFTIVGLLHPLAALIIVATVHQSRPSGQT